MSGTEWETPRSSRTLGALFGVAGMALPEGHDSRMLLAGLTDDSREAADGWLFVAVRGEAADGHRFMASALEKGAALAIGEEVPEGVDPASMIVVEDSREALGRLAQAWEGNPTHGMLTVGVTGTNGKTTVAYLLEAILRAAGRKPALLGTVEYRCGDYREDAPTTTPGALHLARFLGRARRLGADAVVMEVSSHALAQKRVEGLRFDAGVITNVTQDHLDYHKTMDEYAATKALLFERYRPEESVFNFDDETTRAMARAHEGEVWTYSLDPASSADVRATALGVDPMGVRMEIALPVGAASRPLRLSSPLLGRFNASNLLAAAACAASLDVDAETIVRTLEKTPGPPGRLEAVNEGQKFGVYVDYAHTPDAVERVLENVRALTTGRLTVVLGCGGDRDAGKRPLMGRAMGRLADYSIITSDNPRSEDPAKIAEAMELGICGVAEDDAYEICLDRAEAISRAIGQAGVGDSVVIAGKGHETYQISGGAMRHFDDREEARDAIRRVLGGKGV